MKKSFTQAFKVQGTMTRDLVTQALLSAVWRRKPQSEILIHSDQGSRYGSRDEGIP